jgi:hypothetical protein
MTEKIYGRPADDSLQAYKDFIISFTARLTGKPEDDDTTEEEWVASWKKFWNKD